MSTHDSRLSSTVTAIDTDVVVVGAGPCGLFQVFELGLLGLKAHVVDSLSGAGRAVHRAVSRQADLRHPGDPGLHGPGADRRLLEQIRPFGAGLHLGQEVTDSAAPGERPLPCRDQPGTRFDAGAVVIAGGVGSFQPRQLDVPGADELEGTALITA